MSDFPLIESLQDKNNKTPLPKGHEYRKYTISVDGTETLVHIPLRETKLFEETVGESGKMDKYSFNKLMREVRGIRG